MNPDRLVEARTSFPPPEAPILVVGDVLAAGISNRFGKHVDTVRLLTDDARARNRAGASVDVIEADPTAARPLRTALDEETVLIVATGDDGRNLLVSRLGAIDAATETFPLVRDPDNVAPFREAGVQPVCITNTITSRLVDAFTDDTEEDG